MSILSAIFVYLKSDFNPSAISDDSCIPYAIIRYSRWSGVMHQAGNLYVVTKIIPVRQMYNSDWVVGFF